jgi:hypothetical protein
MRGRRVPLSPGRRMIAEYCHFAADTQKGVIARRLHVPRLAAAMRGTSVKPPWTVVFLKAFALVARDMPEFRRAYVKLPWPGLYEVPRSVGNIPITRDLDGEEVLFMARFRDPAALPLGALAAELARCKTAPIREIKDFRTALLVARLPRPFRRLAWWLGLNLGRQRPNFLGTFAISSVGTAEIVYAIHPLTTLVSYGAIGPDGAVDVTFSFDHRVFDGMPVARGLAALEAVLDGAIAHEVADMATV